MKKPVIGITCNYVPPKREEDSPNLALALCYVQAIWKVGGIPQLIPLSSVDDVPDLLDLYDGLLLSGGGGLAPQIEQMASLPGLYEQNPVRHEFDLALTKAALDRGMPILGVCRGHQTLNEALGGTLMNIGNKDHLQTEPGDVPKHEITISEDSILYSCCESKRVQVNSFHRQVVDQPGVGLCVTAISTDGRVEAIEGKSGPFRMGVQFHPEFMIPYERGMTNIYARLIQESEGYRQNFRKVNN